MKPDVHSAIWGLKKWCELRYRLEDNESKFGHDRWIRSRISRHGHHSHHNLKEAIFGFQEASERLLVASSFINSYTYNGANPSSHLRCL